MSRNVELVGKRFGKLVVTRKLSSRRNGSVLWEYLCDCGNIKQATTRHLNRDPKNNSVVRSCGCLQRRKGKNHPQWRGVGDISGGWWRAHITRENSQTARCRVPVTITMRYAWKLFLKQKRKCSLSGLPLIIIYDPQGKSICTASLDRVDSSKGYIPGNVQWVHKDINFMKRTYDVEYFKEMCRLVSKNSKN